MSLWRTRAEMVVRRAVSCGVNLGVENDCSPRSLFVWKKGSCGGVRLGEDTKKRRRCGFHRGCLVEEGHRV